MTQILKNDDYFHKSVEDAGNITANSLTYAGIIGIPLVLMIGFLYDIVGRKVTTVVCFLIGAVTTIMIPVVSPSVVGYDVVRILYIQTLVVMLSNPFINDYVTV